MTIAELLKDTGENPSVSESAETPSPEELQKLAVAPATMLWTLNLVHKSSSGCWVKRWVRSFRIALALSIGAIASLQVGGYFLVRSALREVVRSAVVDVLKEKKIISAEQAETVDIFATRRTDPLDGRP